MAEIVQLAALRAASVLDRLVTFVAFVVVGDPACEYRRKVVGGRSTSWRQI